MRCLLDTNAFLRWVDGRPLPRKVERIVSRRSNECLISVITGWEIILKRQLNRTAADIELAISATNSTLLPIKFRHLDELSRLPAPGDHRDPFDRMLIAQAIAEDVPLISSDTRFPEYKRLQLIWD